MRSLRFLFFALLMSVLFAGAVNSAPVAKTDIQRVFDNWSEQSPHFKGMASPFVRKSYSIKTMEKRQFTSSSMPFYAIELEPEGFVIMNSDDRLAPVLAYSDTGSLNLEDLPENAFRALLKNSMEYNYRTVMRISSFTVFQDSLQPLKEVENAVMWTELSVASADGEPVVSGMGGVTNGPFLTTTWDQTRHFNKLCPETTNALNGYDGRVPAGCVAVAAAQVMNYYEWPYRGSGSHSYTDSDGSITGSHSVVFSDPYDWNNMQDYYRYWTTEPEDAVVAVSELIYEVGVAVDMDYESDGSGAYTSDLNAMMPRAFGYDKGTYIYVPEAPEDVADQIRVDMLAGRPAIVTIPGHAVVADGHVDDGFAEYFHINYGWGIHTNNSWFLVDNIAGDLATGCISGLYPSLVALNKTEAGQTNYSQNVSLAWAIADVRTADVQSVSVLQHVVQSNTFTDAAEDFSNFPSTSSDSVYDWVIDSAGYSGDCFYKSVSYYFGESYHLTSRDKFIPQGGSQLSFQLKAGLASAVFRVMVSDDDGQSWNEEYSLDYYNGGSSWQQVVVGLSSYAGSEILIRFEYVPGSYYSPGGVWLDEISFSGGNWYGWDTLQTFESVTGGVVTNLEVGTNTLAFQAFDGASYGARSPSFTVVVAEHDGDVDDDGLPDDWEILYFGGETNANPKAIASNGINTLLGAYIAGLDPTDPDSLFKASMTNADGFVVQWNAASGRVYSVYGATNLLNGFQPLETNILWPQSSWTDTVSRSENFYKIDVELQE